MDIEDRLTALELKLDRILDIITPKDKPHIILSDFLTMWLEDFRGNVSINTKYKDKTNISNHIIPIIGSMSLSELTPVNMQKFINNITAPRQREHIYVLLKHALRKAVEFGYIDNNPMLSVVMPEHEPTPTAILSIEQSNLFLHCARSSEFYTAYYTLINQGMRPSELLALKKENVKVDYLHITNSWNSRTKTIDKTKTKQSIRTIPYFNNVQEYLSKLSERDSRLFPYQLRHLEDDFCAVRDKCDLNIPRLSLYSLRHTCITRWAESGVHPKVAMKWAGHSNITTTLHYYTHISSDWEDLEVAKTKKTTSFH